MWGKRGTGRIDFKRGFGGEGLEGSEIAWPDRGTGDGVTLDFLAVPRILAAPRDIPTRHSPPSHLHLHLITQFSSNIKHFLQTSYPGSSSPLVCLQPVQHPPRTVTVTLRLLRPVLFGSKAQDPRHFYSHPDVVRRHPPPPHHPLSESPSVTWARYPVTNTSNTSDILVETQPHENGLSLLPDRNLHLPNGNRVSNFPARSSTELLLYFRVRQTQIDDRCKTFLGTSSPSTQRPIVAVTVFHFL
jgi:hypothetical protein